MKNFTKTMNESPNTIIRVDTTIKGEGFTIEVGDTTFVTPKDMTKLIKAGPGFDNLETGEKTRRILGTAMALSF